VSTRERHTAGSEVSDTEEGEGWRGEERSGE
jgi:hypothetical protein